MLKPKGTFKFKKRDLVLVKSEFNSQRYIVLYKTVSYKDTNYKIYKLKEIDSKNTLYRLEFDLELAT